MKVILAATFFLTLATTASAQKIKAAEVPDAVKTKVASLYPNVKIEEWEKEDGKYEAELDMKAETSLLLDASGNLVETEVEIPVAELPKSVSEYVAKNYAGSKISEASKLTTPDGSVTYEAEVKKGKTHFDAIFDRDGNFLKKETE